MGVGGVDVGQVRVGQRPGSVLCDASRTKAAAAQKPHKRCLCYGLMSPLQVREGVRAQPYHQAIPKLRQCTAEADISDGYRTVRRPGMQQGVR